QQRAHGGLLESMGVIRRRDYGGWSFPTQSSAVNSLVPSVLVGIMRGHMKRLLPVLLLCLPGCELIPALLGQNGGAQPETVPAKPGVTTTSPGTAGTPTKAVNTDASVDNGAVKLTSIDINKRLEYVDVYTDLHDPNSQRALVPYLMK